MLRAIGSVCGPWSTICNHNHRARRRQLREKLPPETAYYTTHLPNVRYLTGFRGTTAGLVVADESSCLLVDGRYSLYSEGFESEDIEIKTYDNSRLAALNSWLDSVAIDTMHFEKNNLTYAAFLKVVNNLEVENRNYGEDIAGRLRMEKDPEEMKLIRRAADRTAEVLAELEEWLECGRSEKRINRFLRSRLEERGEARSFYPLVLAGARSAMPHAPSSSRVWQAGEPLLVDVGLKIEGYCADLTRMYFSGGKDVKIKQNYQLSMRAARAAFEKIAADVPAGKVAGAAHDLIAEEESDDLIRHGLGHGLGLEIHESPALKRESERELKAGMVVTLEPGIYIDGTGGARVEHMVLVQEEGAELIDEPVNNFEKELYG